ncbi:MAG: ribonuclease HII [Candidatus Omnitrophota bacterium]
MRKKSKKLEAKRKRSVNLRKLTLLRIPKMLRHERKANRQGFKFIAGLDEAGRGPLAGPVVAAAVILKDVVFKARIDDSKRLTPKLRSLAYREILEKAWIGVGIVCEKVIDQVNIYNATIAAMEQAVANLSKTPDYLLIDGTLKLDLNCGKRCIIRGDSKSLSIACASIVAKVVRDDMMHGYHKKFPKYGFDRHKGYGTKEHFSLIKRYGPSPIHRMSFYPLRSY